MELRAVLTVEGKSSSEEGEVDRQKYAQFLSLLHQFPVSEKKLMFAVFLENVTISVNHYLQKLSSVSGV